MTGPAPGPAPPLAAILERTARRYRPAGRFARHYVAVKLRRDPVNAALLARAGALGHVVDLGCGRGQLGAALLEAGLAASVLGLDWNAAHLAQAEAALAGLPFRAERRDLSARQDVPEADTVLLIDVLYQLRTEVQERLLLNAARAARSLLVIRTADPGRGARSVLTRALEIAGQRFWPHAGAHVNPLPLPAIAALLAGAGFATETAPCWRGTPFANVLLIARRQEACAACRRSAASSAPISAPLRARKEV